MNWFPYILAVLGIFTVVTMWAVVVTEGCRKIKLQYYGFKLASAARYICTLCYFWYFHERNSKVVVLSFVG